MRIIFNQPWSWVGKLGSCKLRSRCGVNTHLGDLHMFNQKIYKIYRYLHSVCFTSAILKTHTQTNKLFLHQLTHLSRLNLLTIGPCWPAIIMDRSSMSFSWYHLGARSCHWLREAEIMTNQISISQGKSENPVGGFTTN